MSTPRWDRLRWYLLDHAERLAVVGDELRHALVTTLPGTLAEAESLELDALATATEWVGAVPGTS